MTKAERDIREKCVELRQEADNKVAEAQRIHDAPSMFLDRDSRCHRLLSEADGIRYAAFVILEYLTEKSK